MFEDYQVTGLSLRAHPIHFVRSLLDRRGAKTTHALTPAFGVKVGTKISCAGLAIIKQRPGTAKGVVFITIEDETGNANLIIRPTLFERYSKEILQSSALLAHGALERIGEVVYIDVHGIESLDAFLQAGPSANLPERSYSY
jgi:error-prone DNA polymerase